MSIIGALDSMMKDEDWVDGALCGQVDPELFHPLKGGSASVAKGICQLCDVRAECLEYALRNGERTGVWGGMSAKERQRLLRRRSA